MNLFPNRRSADAGRAAALCAALSIHAGRAAAYLTETALRLRPCLRAAIDSGTLEYVFLTVSQQ